jgi:very-short-patch-repair endonuclease
MTPAEKRLWAELRGRKCDGLKFRRQQIIDGFITDFFCAEKHLVVEADGPIHSGEEQKKNDEHRRIVFKGRGLKEIRFKNQEIINNMANVLERIKSTARA